jgi:pre-mRNA-splicing factor ATP-dependent RNA helicase DHX15/PRP43
MQALQRNKTTAAQAKLLENGKINYLRKPPQPYSTAYRGLLETRRKLPVSDKRQAFLDAYQKAQVMVLSSDTGSGKTTQIPQFVLFDEWNSGKMVACTQPRRIAASSVAQRVAEELDVELGKEVGYSVRFDNMTSMETRLKYMTDGQLLQEALMDRNFTKYSCIIIDEAHERTMSTDVLIALVKESTRRRKDLKVIIMSATLNAQKFLASFDNAVFFQIPGRTHPVEIFYSGVDISDYSVASCRLVKHIHETMGAGDIILFLTGEGDIEQVCAKLRKNTTGL